LTDDVRASKPINQTAVPVPDITTLPQRDMLLNRLSESTSKAAEKGDRAADKASKAANTADKAATKATEAVDRASQ
jgi:hypothetical protein